MYLWIDSLAFIIYTYFTNVSIVYFMVHNNNLLFYIMYCHHSEILHDKLFQDYLTDQV